MYARQMHGLTVGIVRLYGTFVPLQGRVVRKEGGAYENLGNHISIMCNRRLGVRMPEGRVYGRSAPRWQS